MRQHPSCRKSYGSIAKNIAPRAGAGARRTSCATLSSRVRCRGYYSTTAYSKNEATMAAASFDAQVGPGSPPLTRENAALLPGSDVSTVYQIHPILSHPAHASHLSHY